MVVEPFAIPPASEEKTDHLQPVAIATSYDQDPKGEEDEIDADVNEGVAHKRTLIGTIPVPAPQISKQQLQPVLTVPATV